MRQKSRVRLSLGCGVRLLPGVFVLLTGVGTYAQSRVTTSSNSRPGGRPEDAPPVIVQTEVPEQQAAPSPEVESPASSATQSVQNRIERARALAAAHQLDVAGGELEAIRKSTEDAVIRNVTSVILMGIYLEEGKYARAEALLEETFRARSHGDDASLRTYFALAGQAINGARTHVARYRTFGINVTDPTLPAEAASDLDRLRSLLERMSEQAKEISRERKAYDALALLEDVLGIGLSLARDGEDRTKWEAAYAIARRDLAYSQNQIASLGGIPALPSSTKRVAEVRSSEPTNTNAKTEAITKNTTAAEAKPSEAANSTTKVEVSSKSTAVVSTREPVELPKDGDKPTNAVSGSNAKNAGEKRISTGALNSRATKRIVPAYPQVARTAGISGLVLVFVTVDETGRVAEVLGSEGPRLLRPSAEEAARGWRFSPTAVAGKPLRISGYIEFMFAR